MKVSSEVLVILNKLFLSHKVYLPSIQAIYKMFWDISVVYCSGGGRGGGGTGMLLLVSLRQMLV